MSIAYTEAGEGAALVCLHGGMGIDGRTLRVPGILGLAERGLHVIVPDQRGHGASRDAGVGGEVDVAPDTGGEGLTHEAWAADVGRLMESMALPRIALLGHSYGGFIALEYAVRHAETLTHLVLIATSAGPVPRPTTTFASDDDLRDGVRARWPRLFAGADKHWDLFEECRFSAAAYNAAFRRELPAYDLRDRIARIDVPALLLVGSEDGYLPDMEWLAAHLPRAMLHVFPGVGHFPFLEARGEFMSAVWGFLGMDA